MRVKRLKSFDGLYFSALAPENCKSYVLHVHGGPGFHSAWFEAFVNKSDAYKNSSLGWIFYDQRGCGRSQKKDNVTHAENVSDLVQIIKNISPDILDSDIPVRAVFGHSYGASLAYEAFLKNPDFDLKLILSGRSLHKDLPFYRIITMDLLTLKLNQPTDYEKALKIFAEAEVGAETMFKIKSLVKNRDEYRSKFLWANFETKREYERIISEVDIPIDNELMQSVSKSISAQSSDIKSFDPRNLKQQTLWINGHHDFLMGGEFDSLINSNYIKVFQSSGHYPHLEEADRFLSDVEEFIHL